MHVHGSEAMFIYLHGNACVSTRNDNPKLRLCRDGDVVRPPIIRDGGIWLVDGYSLFWDLESHRVVVLELLEVKQNSL